MALQSLASEGFVMSKFRFVASNSKSDKEREQEYRAYVGVATEIEKSQNSEHRQVRNEILRQQSSHVQAALNSVKPLQTHKFSSLQLELAARSFSPVISDFQPTDINRAFSIKSAFNYPYIKNILTEAEYADLAKRREEYVQFQKDLDEALVLLGDDPEKCDGYYSKLDINEIFPLANAKKQLEIMMKHGRIPIIELLEYAEHLERKQRPFQQTRENEAYTIGYERIYLLGTHSRKTAFNAMIEEEGIEILSVADYEDQFENFKSAMKYRNRKRK